MDDVTSLIAIISEGNTLIGLPLITVEATVQDLRPEVREGDKRLHHAFRPLGVGHAFFRGKLWLASLDGSSNKDCVDKVEALFSEPLAAPEVVELDFADDVQWNRVGKLVVRDAIVHGLDGKVETDKGLLGRGPVVFDLSEREEGTRNNTFIHAGLDFSRVHRAIGGRVLVSVSLVFKALDSNLNRVRDPAVTSAYWHEPQYQRGTMVRLSKRVLPLAILVGERKLSLKRFGVPVGSGAR